MNNLLFIIGPLTGASITALWAILTLRDWSDTQHAILTDAERRAYANGYEQAVTDSQRTTVLRARRAAAQLNLHLWPAILSVGIAADQLTVMAAFTITYVIGVLIAYLLHLTSPRSR